MQAFIVLGAVILAANSAYGSRSYGTVQTATASSGGDGGFLPIALLAGLGAAGAAALSYATAVAVAVGLAGTGATITFGKRSLPNELETAFNTLKLTSELDQESCLPAVFCVASANSLLENPSKLDKAINKLTHKLLARSSGKFIPSNNFEMTLYGGIVGLAARNPGVCRSRFLECESHEAIYKSMTKAFESLPVQQSS